MMNHHAKEQLDLFPAVPKYRPEEDYLAYSLKLALSDEVLDDYMEVFRQHPGEWITGVQFFCIWDKYKSVISHCWGRTMDKLAAMELIEQRKVYYGSESPANPGYCGFGYEYRLKSCDRAVS